MFVCEKAPPNVGLYALGLGGILTLVGSALSLRILRLSVRTPTGRSRDSPTSVANAGAKAVEGCDGACGRGVRSMVIWSLPLYAALAVAFWGIPIARGFSSTVIAANEIDPDAYVWFLAWWPHALAHGLNPFVTHALFVPTGYNLTWATAIPGPSLLMTPVTLFLGPIVSFNLLALAAPAVSAWTASLLCWHLTRRVLASLIGGYLFGFSPYMLRALQGQPNLYLTALIPLIVLLVLLHVQGLIKDRSFLVGMTVLIALQFLTSVETLVMGTVFGSVALGAAYGLFEELRARVFRTAKWVIAGYLGAGVLVSPLLYFMAFRAHAVPNQASSALGLDLLSWLVPDSSLALASSHATGGTPPYAGGFGYLGLPIVIIILIYAWQHRAERAGRLGLACLLVPTIAALGTGLTISGTHTEVGHTTIGLPWAMLAGLPGLNRAIPQRFMLFSFLAVAVIVATWLSGDFGYRRVGLALLAVGSLLPNVASASWRFPLTTPSFFANGEYRPYLRSNDRALILPVVSGERWQAQADLPFQLVGGYLGAQPESYQRYAAYDRLFYGSLQPQRDSSSLHRFLTNKAVSVVVADERIPQAHTLANALGVKPAQIGGVLVYRLRRP